MDAGLKTEATPHHAYSTETQGGMSIPSEVIAVNGKNYVRHNGAWRASPMSMAEMVKQEKENIDSATAYTCKAERDEDVGGQAATVYRTHLVNGATSDGEVWIAKGSGLVLRVEQDIDTGDSTGKTHVSTRYYYANVKAPRV
jgi:hypothetical protein